MSDENLVLATGAAAHSLMLSAMVALWAKGLLSDEEVSEIFDTAAAELDALERASPHPAWTLARGLIERRRRSFIAGSPVPRPS